jgi:hypothetical protein
MFPRTVGYVCNLGYVVVRCLCRESNSRHTAFTLVVTSHFRHLKWHYLIIGWMVIRKAVSECTCVNWFIRSEQYVMTTWNINHLLGACISWRQPILWQSLWGFLLSDVTRLKKSRAIGWGWPDHLTVRLTESSWPCETKPRWTFAESVHRWCCRPHMPAGDLFLSSGWHLYC